MANQTSSLIGADLSGVGGSTALFALGSSAFGTGGTEWQYVEATATFVTGEIVIVNPAGTAKTVLTANLTANTDGNDFGFCQNVISQGEFGWIAKKGRDLYVLVTGTLTAGSDQGLGLGANSGRLGVASAAAVGATMFGVYLTESVSASGVRSVAKAVLTWPRLVNTQVPY